MLDINQIESFYPVQLRVFKKNLLREYLQYKILEIIFDSNFGGKLSFMGGTAIRIVHGNDRFSEDLDFDNLGLTQEDFKKITILVKKKLELEGYVVEIRNVFKRAYHCYLKIPEILYKNELSNYREEKISIRLDTESQGFTYSPEKVIINKFEVFSRINVTPIDILLAQKIYAIFNRRRAMGRDFYDVVFLSGKIIPNLDYLKLKIKINDISDLKNKLMARCKKLDFKRLAQDVEPFLINPHNSKKVLYFYDYVKGVFT